MVRAISICLLASALALTGCSNPDGIHQSQLLLSGDNRFVVPTSARTRDGRPFTGRAYGTFFGEGSMDCVEWSGTFVNGLPDGEFLIYANCGADPRRISYKRGMREPKSEIEYLPQAAPAPVGRREYVLPASIKPGPDSQPYFGIDPSRLQPREAEVVKSAWGNYQRVLAGKDPDCPMSYGLSDGGSTMHDCGTYEIMRVKGLSDDKPGYDYGPSLDFLNGNKVERVSFLSWKEMKRLEARR